MAEEKKTNKINLICERRLEKYKKLSSEALRQAEKNIEKGKEKEAQEILKMVRCYLSDAEHFEKLGNWVNAFACLNYAHGWLDAGVRLGIFDVKDERLFTVK